MVKKDTEKGLYCSARMQYCAPRSIERALRTSQPHCKTKKHASEKYAMYLAEAMMRARLLAKHDSIDLMVNCSINHLISVTVFYKFDYIDIYIAVVPQSSFREKGWPRLFPVKHFER
jgi:hypothetical protein